MQLPLTPTQRLPHSPTNTLANLAEVGHSPLQATIVESTLQLLIAEAGSPYRLLVSCYCKDSEELKSLLHSVKSNYNIIATRKL